MLLHLPLPRVIKEHQLQELDDVLLNEVVAGLRDEITDSLCPSRMISSTRAIC